MSFPLFPCYLLPKVAQEHVVRFMDIYEKVQTSLVSPNFRLAARRVRTKIGHFYLLEKENFDGMDSHDEIRQLFDRPPPTITLSFPSPIRQRYIRFFWNEQKDKVDRLLEGKTRVKIDKDLEMAVIGSNIVIFNSNPTYSKLNDYQFVFDVIFRTFIDNYFDLGGFMSLNHNTPKEIMFPLALRYRNSSCQKVSLVQSLMPNACGNLTSDELSALLDNLEVPEINLIWKTEPEVSYTGILKTKKMQLHRASWLTVENLLTMECEDFEASFLNFTALELNSFVRKWLEGGFEKLKRLVLHNPQASWSTALDGIKGTIMPSEGVQKEVCRSDGKKAVARVTDYGFSLEVHRKD